MAFDWKQLSPTQGLIDAFNPPGSKGGKKAPSNASKTKAWDERAALSEIAMAGAPQFPLQNIPGLTGTEQQAQSILAQLLSGGMFEDPNTSQLYAGLRGASQQEEAESVAALRHRQNLGGMFRSSPGQRAEGEMRSSYGNQRSALLGSLYEKERDRDNPYTRLGAAQQFGALPREVEQQQQLAQFQQQMQQLMFQYNIQAPMLQNVIGNEVWKGKTTGSSTMGDIGAIAGGTGALITALAALSDVRLKTDIKYYPIDVLPGVMLASWKWNAKGNELGMFGVDIGVIAQDLEKVAPDCVITGDDGYKRVLYGKLYAEIAA